MKSIAIITGYMSAVTLLVGLCAFHAAQAGELTSQSASNAGAQAFAIAGGSSDGMDDPQTIYRTPGLSVPPSMFGGSNQNCGASATGGIATPWGSIGGSDSHMMLGCNTRADVAVLWKMGAYDVAKLLMFCNGRNRVRAAFEQAGGVCPTGSTADSMYDSPTKGLESNAASYGAMAAYMGQ